MNSICLTLWILVSGLSALHAQTNGIDQTFNIITAPTGEKLLQWQAKAGRSYFLQVSDPADHLNKWYWSPIIESGSGQSISLEVDATADKRFFRLQYTDQTATDLDNADFDGDGLTNLQEITPGPTTKQTNPLDPDTDHDGTNDGDERDNGSDPTDPDSGGTPPGSDAGGAVSGLGGTGGSGSGGTGGNGNTPTTEDDIKLVYRAAFYNQAQWLGQQKASVELHSASLLALFSGKIGGDTPSIKQDPHYSGSEDDETINAHPHPESATGDYQKIITYSEGTVLTPDVSDVWTRSDASAELHHMFTPLTVQAADPLTTWKEAGNTSFPFGSSEQLTQQGLDPLWFTSRSTASYQFGLLAASTSSATRYRTKDFLQTINIFDEFTGLFTSRLADPPLVSRRFDIPSSSTHSFYENIGTPANAIAPEYGVTKVVTSVPVAIKDNFFATGVDTTSRTAASPDIGYQPYNWIMAPAGNVPGNSQKCNNAMQFIVPLRPGTRLKISCPGATPSPAIISPRVGNEPTVAWHGTANSSDDKTPVFKVGTEESVVDLPIRVKVMKNRTVKVQVHLVNLLKPNGDVRELDSSMIPSEGDLEQYLNKIYATQINAWFKVTVDRNPDGTPMYYQADPRTDGQSAFNLAAPETITQDQQKALDAVGNPPANNISVFIIANEGTFLVQNLVTAFGSTNRASRTCWVLGRSSGDYNSKESLKSTFAHEIGHVVVGYGHPDDNSDPGNAPLVGTDRRLRMMCSHDNRSQENGRLLVKKEWDEAESWLNLNIKDPN